MQSETELTEGSLFAERFEIERLLGAGGMGRVYLARHRVLERLVAIKVIHTNLLADSSMAARFRREALAASRMDHPNILTVFDFGHTQSGNPYLVMEFVEGLSLADAIVQQGRFPLTRALHVLRQIAEALVVAHDCRVVHRDLKPANVLLTSIGRRQDVVKILDFGLAKVLETGVNQGQTVIGSPAYMSPEQCLGEPADHRCDIYSFGILAFELLVGRPPFVGNVLQSLQAHIGRPPPIPSDCSGRTELAPHVNMVLLCCLAKKADERYPSARALLADIVALERGSEPTAVHDVDRESSPTDLLPTVADGSMPPIAALLSPEREAPSTLDELAIALRTRGLGSPEITYARVSKLAVEDALYANESAAAQVEQQLELSEQAARARESRLREGLTQLELERRQAGSSIAAGPPGESDEQRHSRHAVILAKNAAIDERVEQLTELIRAVWRQREGVIAPLRDELNRLRQELGSRRLEVARAEEQLTLRLLELRAQGPLPAEIERLYSELGLVAQSE